MWKLGAPEASWTGTLLGTDVVVSYDGPTPPDAAAVDEALTLQAVPPDLLDVWATAIVAREDVDARLRDGTLRDPRWRRALVKALVARGGRTIDPLGNIAHPERFDLDPDRGPETQTTAQIQCTQMIRRGDALLLLMYDREKDRHWLAWWNEGAVSRTLDLPMSPNWRLALLEPIRDAENAEIAVCAFLNGRLSLFVAHFDGTPIGTAFVELYPTDPTEPHRNGGATFEFFERRGDTLVLFGRKEIVEVPLHLDSAAVPSCEPPTRHAALSLRNAVRAAGQDGFDSASARIAIGEAGLLRGYEPLVIDGWLVSCGPEPRNTEECTLHWLHLATGEHQVYRFLAARGWTVHRNALYFTNAKGLSVSRPHEPPELLCARGDLMTVASAGANPGCLLVGAKTGVERFDAEGAPLGVVPLPDGVSYQTCVRFGEGAIFGYGAWAYVGSEGLLACGEKSGSLQVGHLPGHLYGWPAASHMRAGHTLFRAGAGGSLQRTELPFDFVIDWQCETAALLRPTSVGFESPPRGLFWVGGGDVVRLLSESEEHMEQLLAPSRTPYPHAVVRRGFADDRGVWLCSRRFDALHRWQPAKAMADSGSMDDALAFLGEPLAREAPPWLAPAPVVRHRKERKTGFQTHNPRDDWPLPGLLVDDAVVVCTECAYGGTWGVVEDAAVRLERGGQALLVDCELVQGGVRVSGRSTLILVRCTSKEPIWVEAGSHVVLLDCDPEKSATIGDGVVVRARTPNVR